MRKRKRRKGTWPPGGAIRTDSRSQVEPAAEPGANPQPRRRTDGKSRRMAKRFTWKAFQALAAVMDDREAAGTARVSAANTILEWGHGKRGDSAKPPVVINKTVKVDWGEE